MSTIDTPVLAPGAAGLTTPNPRRPRLGRGLVTWTLAGCALLAASGVVRGLQDRRFEVEKSYLAECPFPLKTLPKEFDGWKIVPGGDRTLDPLTTRITGATEHVMRTYVDELTGVTLSVLILFGPAEPVLPHTPQVCYPSCGFTSTEESTIRNLKGRDGAATNDQFRTGGYAKSGGRAMLREVVYHSFRLDGPWSPDIGAGKKFPRKNPGIFKVQVQRRVAEGERRDDSEPIENFLARLIPEIERRIAESQAAGSAPHPKALTPPPTIPTAASMGGMGPAWLGREMGSRLAPA